MLDVRIPLHDRAGRVVAEAIVDPRDAHLAEERWHPHYRPDGRIAAQRWQGSRPTRRKVLLHRVILGLQPGDGVEVDHRNGDALDNRRGNLRATDKSGNMQNRHGLDAKNTSGFRGVSFDRRAGRWAAYGTIRGKRRNLGLHDTAAAAGAAAAAWRAENMPALSTYDPG